MLAHCLATFFLEQIQRIIPTLSQSCWITALPPTRGADPMVGWRWATVCNAGTALGQFPGLPASLCLDYAAGYGRTNSKHLDGGTTDIGPAFRVCRLFPASGRGGRAETEMTGGVLIGNTTGARILTIPHDRMPCPIPADFCDRIASSPDLRRTSVRGTRGRGTSPARGRSVGSTTWKFLKVGGGGGDCLWFCSMEIFFSWCFCNWSVPMALFSDINSLHAILFKWIYLPNLGNW